MAAKSAQRNRLAEEKSPYLLQHAGNPVDWYPWGEEAFAKAAREGKPVFLSIGYSTCHWCHVMERESFESEAVAAVLNAHFVSIKVDREERPDLDKIYMTAVQAMGLGGGWPLSAWLTPDRRPFYGGTYFPPESRHGRMGFREVLLRIHDLWTRDRERLERSAGELTEQLRVLAKAEPDAGAVLSEELVEQGAHALAAEYDPQHGGFGGAPKFPRPVALDFLMRHAKRAGDGRAAAMVAHTLRAMAAGGMYDQLGGGFSRYSVDARWLVPHFEKMLYDNAQLVHAYLDGLQAMRDPAPVFEGLRKDADNAEAAARFETVVRETLEYVLRDMASPEGAFFSAEDADSEGREGAFYVWSPEQLREALGEEEARFAARLLGVSKEGNFEDHSAAGAQPPSQNVVSLAMDPAAAAGLAGLPEAGAGERWARVRRALFEARGKRVRPQRDDKVLTSWNGLMIGAMARAGAVLGEARFVEAARRAAAFLKEAQWDAASGVLRHSWRAGRSDPTSLVDDYSCLGLGLVWLARASGEGAWLAWAGELAEAMVRRFGDAEEGGFFMSAEDGDKGLLFRVKEDYDGAEPSGNATAARLLLELGELLERREWIETAVKALRLFEARLRRLPHAVPALLAALDFHLGGKTRVAIAAGPDGEGGRRLAAAVEHGYHPSVLVVWAGRDAPTEFLRGLGPVDGKAAAYLCRGTVCDLPVCGAELLARKLEG